MTEIQRFMPVATVAPRHGHVYVALTPEAAEVQFGCVVRTVELIPNRVLADYGADGQLMGIEIL